MKIAFRGAARTVTGSKHLLTLKNGKKYLLDCGMFQGLGKETDILNRDFGFNPAEVDFLILSHAHIDHSAWFKIGGWWVRWQDLLHTRDKELCAVLLEDSAGIQQDDVKYINKRRAAAAPHKPLYTGDAHNAMTIS